MRLDEDIGALKTGEFAVDGIRGFALDEVEVRVRCTWGHVVRPWGVMLVEGVQEVSKGVLVKDVVGSKLRLRPWSCSCGWLRLRRDRGGCCGWRGTQRERRDDGCFETVGVDGGEVARCGEMRQMACNVSCHVSVVSTNLRISGLIDNQRHPDNEALG